MDLAILIPAVLSYLREKGGFATKTKLLKLLYLLDIEAYRSTRATLSGFQWIFYLYGPWAARYDEALENLERTGLISLHRGSRPDLDTIFVNANESVPLSKAFTAIREELKARRIIEAWADRPTGEMLDYVYFHTAPMRDARRGEPLNFDSVLEEEPAPEYRGVSSSIDTKTLAQRRREFHDATKNIPGERREAVRMIQPNYDPDFWQAIETLDRDPD
jgi:hypothetical protein